MLREIENKEQFEFGGLKSAKLFNGNDIYIIYHISIIHLLKLNMEEKLLISDREVAAVK